MNTAPQTLAREEADADVVPRLAVVVAVFNEAENVEPVCGELIAALEAVRPYEVIFVDDGSSDATFDQLRRLAAAHSAIRVLRHDRRCGKTAALRTGITAARAPWVATMDGDGQNDPVDVVHMIERAWEAPEAGALVAGVRRRRNDPLSRRIATKLANGFRQAVLGDRCPDTGCGLKAFRREDFLRLPAFEGMHRFLPALFQAYGRPLINQPVDHRPRLRGKSKYTNFGRAMVGIGDVLGVIWLRSRTHLPGRVSELGAE